MPLIAWAEFGWLNKIPLIHFGVEYLLTPAISVNLDKQLTTFEITIDAYLEYNEQTRLSFFFASPTYAPLAPYAVFDKVKLYYWLNWIGVYISGWSEFNLFGLLLYVYGFVSILGLSESKYLHTGDVTYPYVKTVVLPRLLPALML